MGKVFTLFILLGFLTTQAFAQPGTSPSLSIYGKVVDGTTSKGIEGVSFQLVSGNKDSLSGRNILATVISTKKGDFLFESVVYRPALRLRISAIGYTAAELPVFTEKTKGPVSDLDMGNIKLVPDPKQLEAVTVTGTRSLLQLGVDRKIYNVEKDLSVAGGTALDVMKNVPSVTVDLDGNVSMRNAAPQIFIDGRPTTLTLDQIPADQIASIEIISNPSAKYDASGGGAGILNIVFKKNRRAGYNGSIRAGLDKRLRPSAGADLNFKYNKFNFFGSGMVNMRKTISEVETYRYDSIQNAYATFNQDNSPVTKGIFAFLRLGTDYFIDNRNTITVSGNLVNGHFKTNDILHIDRDTVRPNAIIRETANRTLMANVHFRNYGASLGFKHNFARSGKEFTSDINFNYSENTNTSDYQTRLYDQNNQPKNPVGAEQATGGGNNRSLTFQADYVDPLTKDSKIELGIRTALRDYNNWNDNYVENLATQQLVLIPQIGVRYAFNDIVNAAYVTYSRKYGNFSYQAGLRAENSAYSGDYISRGTSFKNDYPVSLFPSLYLTFKLDDANDLQLNYSRKINRPNFFQLVPFVDFSDSLNLSVGNPNLIPEFTNLVELAYSSQLAKGQSLLLSLYGRLTEDLITRYQYIDSVINPSKPARYNTFINADKSNTYGAELTLKNKITNWWDITTNANVFRSLISAGKLTGTPETSRTSWFGKMSHNFKLPASFSLQLSGDYQSKTLVPASSPGNRGGGGGMFGPGSFTQSNPQGYIKPQYGLDVSLRKDFGKSRASSLTLQFSDVLRTRYFGSFVQTSSFMQETNRRRDPQMIRLNFNWKFGKMDTNLFKRRTLRMDGDSMQGMP